MTYPKHSCPIKAHILWLIQTCFMLHSHTFHTIYPHLSHFIFRVFMLNTKALMTHFHIFQATFHSIHTTNYIQHMYVLCCISIPFTPYIISFHAIFSFSCCLPKLLSDIPKALTFHTILFMLHIYSFYKAY